MQLVFLMQNGQTPLTGALVVGDLEVVRLLVEMGADVNRADKVRRRGLEGEVNVRSKLMSTFVFIHFTYAQ